MPTKKYPVGTDIIFTAKSYYSKIARNDSGKVGTVVRDCNTKVSIFIFGSENNDAWRKPQTTWIVSWDDIKPALVKGQQLVFEFMDNG